MNVKLKVLEGAHAGKLIPLAGDEFIIGRAEGCHLRAGSEAISRQHCAILLRDSYVGVKDFGSRNGTLVNGVRVEGELELHAGDRLQIGPLAFEVLAEISGKGTKRPPVKNLSDMAARTAQSAGKQTVNDDEITSWLGDPETPASGKWTVSSDTQSVKFNSDTVAMGSPSPTDPAVEPKHEQQKPGAGKLPKIEAPKPKDSREAAVNILKQLSKRK